MMQRTVMFILPVLMALLIPICGSAQTSYQGGSNARLLYGENFEPRGTDLATLTLEHAGSYQFLEHFGFIDLYYVTDTEQTRAHLEWYPKESLSGMSGRRFGAGPLSDVLLGGGVNADFNPEENSWVWLAGPVWQFNLPGFDSFQLETYYYRP